MGIWSVLFPGDEGVLADLFWSNQQTSSGITLKNQIYKGTPEVDIISFAQLSLSFNPYQSEVYLYEGSDSVRTVGTSSGTKFYLGDGDDFITALDGLRYSRIESGIGDDTVWIKQSLFDREGLYQSIITTDTGSDYILIEKEDRLADSMTGVLGGGIFSGDGDDRLIIKGYGLLVQSSGSLLTYADGSTSRDGIINLGEGRDFLGIEKWNAFPPSGSISVGSSPYLLNSDIDLGGGDDIVDLRSLDFSSTTEVLLKGGEGYDVVILPLDISTAPDWLQGFEEFAYAPIDVNEAPTDLVLSIATFNENIPAGSAVASLSTIDPEASNTFTYSLVSGNDYTDSNFFTLNGDQLKINSSPDFERKSSYTIRVRTTDQGGLSFEKDLFLNVQDMEEPSKVQALSLNPSTMQLLYAAYYGRPGDVAGVKFWQSKISESGFSYAPLMEDDLTDSERPLYDRIVVDFGDSAESQRLYMGKSFKQSSNAVYQNCFGRDAELDPVTGENYWVGKLERSEISLSQLAAEVALGAQGSDLAFFSNRLGAANIFYRAMDTPAEQLAYSGVNAAVMARNWLLQFGASSATSSMADQFISMIVTST